MRKMSPDECYPCEVLDSIIDLQENLEHIHTLESRRIRYEDWPQKYKDLLEKSKQEKIINIDVINFILNVGRAKQKLRETIHNNMKILTCKDNTFWVNPSQDNLDDLRMKIRSINHDLWGVMTILSTTEE